MEKTWFTKGPWWHDNNEGYGANNIWANTDGDVLGKDLVATGVGDSAEAEANAHLIAAAPDMYAALDRLVANLSEGDFISTTRIDEAIAALAKARGET
jgi:hypothetical protein